MTKDHGQELCHSTWCPQTGNCVDNNHNPNLIHYSEQTGLFFSVEREFESGRAWLIVVVGLTCHIIWVWLCVIENTARGSCLVNLRKHRKTAVYSIIETSIGDLCLRH